MWIQTKFGFFSIVRKKEDAADGTLTIRARVEGDLENLRDHFLPEMGEISKTPHNDYRFRARAPQAAVANALAKAVMDIGYGNFKNEVAAKQGNARAKVYGKVWDVLYQMQDNPAFVPEPKGKPAAKSKPSRSRQTTKASQPVVEEIDEDLEPEVIEGFNQQDSDAWQVATRSSWETSPMPERHTTVRLDFWLDPQEAESVRLGYVPIMMEEKWFAYFEANMLYQHRSWTGFCIDQIHFVEENGGLRATHAEVNREREQYSETDDRADVARICSMVRSLAHLDRSVPRKDPMAAMFEMALQPNYLGSPDVVAKAIEPFFRATLDRSLLLAKGLNWLKANEKVMEENGKLVRIFSGNDPEYTALPSWNTRAELGNAVVRYFDLDPDYYADESMECVLSEGLAGVSLHISNSIKRLMASDQSKEELDRLAERTFLFVRDVLLGINTVTAPDKTLKTLG